jgi:hypothetical protein
MRNEQSVRTWFQRYVVEPGGIAWQWDIADRVEGCRQRVAEQQSHEDQEIHRLMAI